MLKAEELQEDLHKIKQEGKVPLAGVQYLEELVEVLAEDCLRQMVKKQVLLVVLVVLIQQEEEELLEL